jgi:hypothetical protein
LPNAEQSSTFQKRDGEKGEVAMNNMPKNPKQGMKDRSIAFYVILAAALVTFIQTFTLLSPILLSFILIMLITLSVNPAVSWMRSLTGSTRSRQNPDPKNKKSKKRLYMTIGLDLTLLICQLFPPSPILIELILIKIMMLNDMTPRSESLA